MHASDRVKSQKVLVVDASRVVRASLSRCLAKTHVVCEESDGESAWQSLVLDASIVAVISGLDITGIEGAGLVERMRASKLARINAMPFYQLASESLAENLRQSARRLGVSDFIPKASPAGTLERLFSAAPMVGEVENGTDIFGMETDVGLGDLSSRFGRLASLDVAPLIADSLSVKGKRGVEKKLLERAVQSGVEQPAEGATALNASVLIFGIDDYAGLCQRLGVKMGEKIVARFSGLLAGKVRSPEDVLHLSDGRVGIVSSHVDREHCTAFARRVCKALAAATIALGDKVVKATASAGVAAVPQDGVALSAEELFYLASSRLEAAHAAGGSRVVNSSVGGGRNLSQAEFIDRLKGLLVTASPVTEMSCKSWLRSICIACRNSRPDGEPPPCSASVASGLCANRPSADS
jgi:two-component system, cell cycle response regulator